MAHPGARQKESESPGGHLWWEEQQQTPPSCTTSPAKGHLRCREGSALLCFDSEGTVSRRGSLTTPRLHSQEMAAAGWRLVCRPTAHLPATSRPPPSAPCSHPLSIPGRGEGAVPGPLARTLVWRGRLWGGFPQGGEDGSGVQFPVLSGLHRKAKPHTSCLSLTVPGVLAAPW